ncbi:MAG: thiamine-phosphate pyrophosphorylase [Candidatus Omnitrophica bacterium]|nr:thiamine-phosphate pyrophosphorylase [Candidatus Omnitrophota bacterium]
MKDRVLRIIDANLNRAREGLRVCEDIVRFAISDKDSARCLKLIRHNTTDALLHNPRLPLKKILKARDTKKDVLKTVDFKKRKRIDIIDIFMANVERVKESLRVLEECSKIIDEDTSFEFRRLRFKTYDAEKKIVTKLLAISGNGQCPIKR